LACGLTGSRGKRRFCLPISGDRHNQRFRLGVERTFRTVMVFPIGESTRFALPFGCCYSKTSDRQNMRLHRRPYRPVRPEIKGTTVTTRAMLTSEETVPFLLVSHKKRFSRRVYSWKVLARLVDTDEALRGGHGGTDMPSLAQPCPALSPLNAPITRRWLHLYSA
jgi:hypothetical protein